jgi:porin
MLWYRLILVLALMISWMGLAVAQDKKPADAKPAAAEDATIYPVPDYSGDFLNRSYLTGDWGGLRSKLADHGVQFDVDLLQVFQDVTTGGNNQTGRYGGVYSMALKLDIHKTGLWPGAFLYVRAQAPFA